MFHKIHEIRSYQIVAILWRSLEKAGITKIHL